MNKWIQKSMQLAKSKGYLVKLFKIYPIELGTIRDISDNIKREVQKAFRNKSKIALIKELLKLPKFPINDPYIASLRRHPLLLYKNPETVERISKKLFAMGINNILELASEPKSPSHQFGIVLKNG